MKGRDQLFLVSWSVLLASILIAIVGSLVWRDAQPPKRIEDAHRDARLLWLEGRQDEARSAYEELITLRPREPDFWMFRGIMRYHAREWDAAVRDFRQVRRLLGRSRAYVDLDAYAALYEWLATARRGSIDEANVTLREQLDEVELFSEAWSRLLARHLVGDVSQHELMQRAWQLGTLTQNAAPAPGHYCEATFYAGSRALIVDGNVDEARMLFIAAVASNAVEYYEYSSVFEELRQMGATPMLPAE